MSDGVPHAYAFREIEGEVSAVVQRVIGETLGGGEQQQQEQEQQQEQPPRGFSAVQARAQVEDINRQCVVALQKMSANFKWVVNTLITQRAAAGAYGLHMENVALWDAHTDGCLCVKWAGRNVSCVTSVYCLAI